MKNIGEAISEFGGRVVFFSAFAIVIILALVIAILIIGKIIKKKSLKKNSACGIVRGLLFAFIIPIVAELVMMIPAYIDIFTDNIKVVEVSDYVSLYQSKSHTFLHTGKSIAFTTSDGERLKGRLTEEFDIPSEGGHGKILYAKYSKCILDCDLHE